jgi:hypothetical protein
MAFHYVFNDYSSVEFNLPNHQKYTIKVLGAILLLMKLSSLISGGGKTIFRGGGGLPSLHPPKKPGKFIETLKICFNILRII